MPPSSATIALGLSSSFAFARNDQSTLGIVGLARAGFGEEGGAAGAATSRGTRCLTGAGAAAPPSGAPSGATSPGGGPWYDGRCGARIDAGAGGACADGVW